MSPTPSGRRCGCPRLQTAKKRPAKGCGGGSKRSRGDAGGVARGAGSGGGGGTGGGDGGSGSDGDFGTGGGDGNGYDSDEDGVRGGDGCSGSGGDGGTGGDMDIDGSGGESDNVDDGGGGANRLSKSSLSTNQCSEICTRSFSAKSKDFIEESRRIPPSKMVEREGTATEQARKHQVECRSR